MLKLITDEKEIARCQKLFETAMKRALPKHEVLTIGYQGGKIDNNEVFYKKNLWYSTLLLDSDKVSIPRYWNAFGLGKRQGGNQIIIVEINPPVSGATKQVEGLFAKDEKTDTSFILHRGRIGGGRSGIGKDAFKKWYRGKWANVYDDSGNQEEAILISSLGSKGLATKIHEFVNKVAQFKEEVTNGSISRMPTKLEDNLSFDPEFHGKKRGKRPSVFEYERYHGLIVNALEKKIRKTISSNYTIFNTSLIDLGIQKSGETQKIFEVKTLADRQSIYTGIGQLMFHSAGNNSIEKILVLPLEEYNKNISKMLGKLNITVLTYTISDEEKVKILT